MRTVYTHVRPDLDAATSVWFFKKFIDPLASVKFVPANWDGVGMEITDVALDIEAGGRGVKGRKLEDGKVLSCFASLVADEDDKVAEILRPVVEFVEAQDSTSDAFLEILSSKRIVIECGHNPEADMAQPTRELRREDIPASIRIGGLGSMLRVMERLAKGSDAETVRRFGEVLDSIYESGVEMREAEAEAEKAEMIARPGDINATEPVALVVSNSTNPFVHAKVFEKKGVKVIVRLDGHNLLAVREGKETFHLGKVVKPFIEAADADEAKEWFYHSAGFLAARGTLKAPATTPSRVDARALAKHIASVI